MASKSVLEQKKKEVDELAKRIEEAKVLILADYRGINVEDVTNLRTKLRKALAEYKVIKNNITKRAMEQAKIQGLEELLEGPTAVILGNSDYLETAKIIYEYSKDNEFYKIKGGFINGKVTSTEEIITLAQLPSREALIAGLAGALLGNITKLAALLDQVAKKKQIA